MQIVIDIDRLPTPEDQFYFFYNQDGDMFFGRSIYDCKKVVVLPEHHGRLIDADGGVLSEDEMRNLLNELNGYGR